MKNTILHYKDDISMFRDENGVLHIEAKSEEDVFFGQGYAQAMDRGMQMLFTRILGQGRASECFASSEEMLATDIFFKRMNWARNTTKEVGKLSPENLKLAQAFCAGVNSYLEIKTPWELGIFGYRPEPWRIEDTILFFRIAGYISLQQSQAEMEKLVVEMVQAGVERDKLEELFPGHLEGLEVDLLKKVRLHDRIVPAAIKWQPLVPKLTASNNWVLAGSKTASGNAILANDPHLEVNRLPNVWQEIVLKVGDRYCMGATMPSLPGIIIGRNNELSWGLTYSFMDSVDSWVEECREGKYRRGSHSKTEWVRFRERREIIKRKKKPDHMVTFYENEHGVLEGDPYVEGLYLASRWSSSMDSGAKTLECFLTIFNTDTVREGMDVVGEAEITMNWVLADSKGNIGYQMSGLMPKRRSGVSGLVPLPGWDAKNDWKGYVTHQNLPRKYNPEEGYLVTANNDLNFLGKAHPINLPMGAYRRDRIAQILEERNNFVCDDMIPIQYDDYSLQAEEFLKILRPLLPDTENGKLLKNWDCRYDLKSLGARVFEKFYNSLVEEIFAINLGEKVSNYITSETAILTDFYACFDRVLLSETSVWFEGRKRDDIYRKAMERALQSNPKEWGQTQKIVLRHIILGGKLARLFRIDRGPVRIPGGRATPHQGQIYRSKGLVTSFVASLRFITEMNVHNARTNMIGGPSDRPFSKWYCSDLKNWVRGKYKLLEP